MARPRPSRANDEVLIRVRAASINPMEVFVAAGYLQSMLSAPMTPGTDFAGEVGSFAAQFAKQHGAHVIGTAAGKDEGFARQLGIDEFIDYKATRFEDRVRDVDVVLATVAGDVIPRTFNVMQPNGRLVTTGRIEGAEEAQRRGLQATSMVTRPSIEDLNEISRLIDAGQVKVYVSDTLPLAEARRALEVSQQRDTGRRKVVLSVK